MEYLRELLKQLKKEFPKTTSKLFDGSDLSLFANIHRAFLHLAECEGPCLYFQEDAKLTSGFKNKLKKFVRAGHHCDVTYLYYFSNEPPPYCSLKKYKGGEVALFAYAEVFRAYRDFCAKPAYRKWVKTQKTKHDLFFRKTVLPELQLVGRAIIPSLVQHTGDYSAKHRSLAKYRRSPTFEE